MKARFILETLSAEEKREEVMNILRQMGEIQSVDHDSYWKFYELSQSELTPEEIVNRLLEAYEPKDLKRVQDFAKKSGGDFEKEVGFAKRMAKTLTNMDKAIGRAEAAAEVYGGWNEIVEIFYNKAKELGYEGPPPAERLQVLDKPVLGSKLPPEQRYKKPSTGRNNSGRSYRRYRGGSWEGNAVLPLGKVNLRDGETKAGFNVYDWGDGTVEVWRDNKGVDTSHLDLETDDTPKTGISAILAPKSKEEINKQKRQFFNYKLVFTSGDKPLHEIGEWANFFHDQNGNNIGHWEMVDYVPLKHLKELILPYGKNITSYTYK